MAGGNTPKENFLARVRESSKDRRLARPRSWLHGERHTGGVARRRYRLTRASMSEVTARTPRWKSGMKR